MRFKLQTKTSGNKWEYIKLPFKFYYSDRIMSRTFLSVLTDDYQSNWQVVIGRTDVWATQSGNNWWLFRICVICLNPITAHNEISSQSSRLFIQNHKVLFSVHCTYFFLQYIALLPSIYDAFVFLYDTFRCVILLSDLSVYIWVKLYTY